MDVPGIVTFSAAAGALTYGLIQANENGWSEVGSWALDRRRARTAGRCSSSSSCAPKAPMLDMGLMRNRVFVGILLAALVVTLAAFASFTYTSIWLQSVLGLSPIEAGLTGLPLSLASFAVSAAIGRFLHGSRPGPIIGGGMLFIGVRRAGRRRRSCTAARAGRR